MKYSVGIIGLGRIAWTLEDERQRRSPATHPEAFRQNLSTELVEDARAALELVMAIRESGELGEIVRLPLKNRKRRILTR